MKLVLKFTFLHLFFLVFPSLTMALDTTEPIGAGEVDVELYLGIENIKKSDLSLVNELVFGFGLTDRLDLFLALAQSLEMNALRSPSFSSFLGIAANAVDTAVFDMDILLGVGLENIGRDARYGLHPAFEFNFDADPEMLTWGIYLRLALPLYAEETLDALGEGLGDYQFKIDLVFTLGFYYLIAEKHRILLEQSVTVHQFSKAYTLEALAVGYNVQVKDDLELIFDLGFTLPVGEEAFSSYFVLGFIWALS